ncbi:hypothetical protein NGTWS0302_32270 [Mycolicibacterium cyprinidarum]|uniref:Uncharacterized protein n=1 Tax=Mycolicibacterium cyprinidarum TaxID=2860311 RepID=A0ABQ4V5R1_9MYCO|nr:hypothetical protein NGTWS1702_32760 [Mycolicibacterium sp. NGTWSNA01]GJF12612.1 hypothetical protein NGTWS1803_22760 [Mycolicibacterium sp. NGTWS1803]GJF12829.1 hypothetical protein NGTWS0302_32270 [Mycolicibacterium sp. NGTWS0302]
MEQTITERLHIIEGDPWKDAVISLLDSRSPYRPWRYGFGEAKMGDPVAIVLNTDPPSVMTELGRVGADGRPHRALINWPMTAPSLIDLATLTVMADFAEDPRAVWVLRGDTAIQMESALAECAYRHDGSMRSGHSSVVQARILIHSEGECAGCGDDIDLTGDDARDVVNIHTIDAAARPTSAPVVRTEREASYLHGTTPESWWRPEVPADLPGVLCCRCVRHMQDEGIGSLVDFRFARHPKCPRCRVSRTQKALYGHILQRVWQPWLDYRGCGRTDQHAWTCGACGLEWC